MILQKTTPLALSAQFDNDLPPVSQQSVAAYTASMLAGLSQVAKGVELNMLAYLLDMARLEAENQLK